jgi:GNAT superfamily N-acetyltransferase
MHRQAASPSVRPSAGAAPHARDRAGRRDRVQPFTAHMATDLHIHHGTPADVPRLLALFDASVAWLVERGQSGQWGSEPFSSRPANVARAEAWAADGGLWLAVDESGADAGAIVLGEAFGYVPAPDRPELYVQVLLTDPAFRGRGVGALLIDHAAGLAREQGAQQLRVDCWDGVPALPAAYERLGFTRVGSFEVGGWPGAILVREL